MRRKALSAPSASDHDHINYSVGMAIVKDDFPEIECVGSKLAGPSIQFLFKNRTSMDYWFEVISALPGPSTGHGGYYCTRPGESAPFRRWTAWAPKDFSKLREHFPKFLASSTAGVLNPESMRVVGDKPSSAGGMVIFFDVSTEADELLAGKGASGIMCVGHKLKFHREGEGVKRTQVRPDNVVKAARDKLLKEKANKPAQTDADKSSAPKPKRRRGPRKPRNRPASITIGASTTGPPSATPEKLAPGAKTPEKASLPVNPFAANVTRETQGES